MAEALSASSFGCSVEEKLSMRYTDSHRKNGTVTTQVTCAVLFTLFSFIWLYWFQADVMAVAQHALSGGHTQYNRLIGASLITILLLMLQQAVMAMVSLRRRSHALTYVPSMLALAVLSHVGPDLFSHSSYSYLCWSIPLVLLLWWGCVWLARQMIPFDQDKQPLCLFSRRVWMNVLLMAGMMLGVAAVGNTHAVFHFRAHAEVALSQGDTQEVLRVGKRSHESDVHLTMIRAYALARNGELGEHLFEYPVYGEGADLIPMPESHSRFLLLPNDSIYVLCGARPVGIHTTNRYLDLLEKDSLATPAVADYRLCALLVDRKIDAFARTIGRYYPINDQLPRHYREALTLYAHLRSQPVHIYRHAVMEEDWNDFQKLEDAYPAVRQRKEKVADRYFGSYWYYYFYRR